MTYTERMSDWCGFHKSVFVWAAADALDNPDVVDLAEAFNRYDAKCRAGQGCGR